MPPKQNHKNRLFLVRKKFGLEQKQVAALLGHKTADQISRYERGAKLPSLKTAFKLGMIYHLPVRVLFYGYYETCLNEIKRQTKTSKNNQNHSDLAKILSPDEAEYCTFAEKLKSIMVRKPDLDAAGSHIAKVVQLRGEKSGHLTKRK